jgi:hypothetical protein
VGREHAPNGRDQSLEFDRFGGGEPVDDSLGDLEPHRDPLRGQCDPEDVQSNAHVPFAGFATGNVSTAAAVDATRISNALMSSPRAK